MPFSASEAFLLWHETQVTGRWRNLLNAPATKDSIWALWMLQWYPLRPVTQADADVAAKSVIEAGWGK